MSDFYKQTLLFLSKSINNSYPDNFDWKTRKLGRRHRAVLLFETMFNRLMRLFGENASILISARGNFYLQNVGLFQVTFDMLKDQESRDKYIELLVYKMIGFTKVKLSLNNEEFWSSRDKVDSYRKLETIPVNFGNGHLDLFDLSSSGYNVKLYYVNNGIFVVFILQQYNYQNYVCVQPGDIVIDAGGCWGDTALYFAAKGASEVFVYEFIPSNIAIMQKNLSLNEQYSKRITLVNNAVWESSDIDLSYDDSGPSSRVAELGKYKGKTKTLSIDDLVERQNLSSVDFIKMDIEGAELSALKGAENTIRKFKPKLAISVYHKQDDLILIPSYIRSLYPDYEFYLDYYTIVGEEIVLYAVNKDVD